MRIISNNVGVRPVSGTIYEPKKLVYWHRTVVFEMPDGSEEKRVYRLGKWEIDICLPRMEKTRKRAPRPALWDDLRALHPACFPNPYATAPNPAPPWSTNILMAWQCGYADIIRLGAAYREDRIGGTLHALVERDGTVTILPNAGLTDNLAAQLTALRRVAKEAGAGINPAP